MIDPTKQLVTVFGGGGFVGRYVCEALLRRGARVVVAQRDLRQANVIQPLGQVGQVGFVAADVTNAASVRRAVAGASAVVNLVGTFGRAMQAVHVDGARRIAEAATAEGAEALVHLSAIGADPHSPSNYGRTKGEGEGAVREAFAGATILRPSVIFGPEDQLTNRFAAMGRFPLLPVLAAKTRFQPVYVRDVGKAVALAALDPATYSGTSFDLGGPQVLTMEQLYRAIFDLTGQTPDLAPLPDFVGDLMSRVGFLPGAPITRDQWLMLQHDNVAAADCRGLRAFGIEPTPLAAVGSEWLDRFGKFPKRPQRTLGTGIAR